MGLVILSWEDIIDNSSHEPVKQQKPKLVKYDTKDIATTSEVRSEKIFCGCLIHTRSRKPRKLSHD